ncbi:MAG: hypothetical protein D6761_05755 [Candidatus Dadabacteria bacterium]|nr:MAG: hypothetical protein D6761_05755 [Candidatus Dadabacteria bacterium]
MPSDTASAMTETSGFPHLAAVAFRRLPLQLLLRDLGGSMRQPVALLDQAGPHGLVVDMTPAAVRQGVRPGMTAMQAQLQCAALRLGAVAGDMVASAAQELQQFLLRYSPVAEVARDWPEICWLDATGLGEVQASLRTWAEQIQQDLWREYRLQVSIVVGGTRLGTAVLALGRRVVVVLDHLEQEQRAMAQAPLNVLVRSTDDLQLFDRLGLRRLEDLAGLREVDVVSRFSSGTVRLWRMMRLGLEPDRDQIRIPVPAEATLTFPDPVAEHEALLFAARRLLQPLLKRLEERMEVVEQIEYVCELEDAAAQQGVLAPANPGRDERLLLDLLRVHWQSQEWHAPVSALRLSLRGVRETGRQQALYTANAGRDGRKTEQALDRLRAAFGQDALMVAELRAAHLPEGRVVWRPLQRLAPARPRQTAVAPLVRRLYQRPRQQAGETDRRWWQWGRVLLAGGWWHRWVRRRYYFEGNGRVLRWMYEDLMRGGRYEQGRIE